MTYETGVRFLHASARLLVSLVSTVVLACVVSCDALSLAVLRSRSFSISLYEA